MQTLGKYELHEEIGRGGFSIVYRAIHKLLETEAAVKVLNVDRLNDSTARERMIQEAKIAANLKHPNIINVFDLIQEDSTIAVAMEYIPGGNLRQWVEANSPPIEKIIMILSQISEALDHIHSQRHQSDRPLIHRDVKPENILMDMDAVTGNPRAKLSDFGLALDIQNSPDLTQAQGIPGTAYYISPEQVESLPKDSLDGRTDQYSLGVLAYELLVGKRPFEGNDPIAIMNKRLDEEVEAPSKENPRLPVEFDAPLLKALSIKPENRFKTCTEFSRALSGAWQDSRLRRVRELIEVAQQAASEGNFKAARSSLEEATNIEPNDHRLNEARKGIDEQSIRAQTYAEAVQSWITAKQKAKAVLDLDPKFVDKDDILVKLGARAPTPPPFDLQEWLKQIGIGMLVAVPFAILLGYWFILWMVDR